MFWKTNLDSSCCTYIILRMNGRFRRIGVQVIVLENAGSACTYMHGVQHFAGVKNQSYLVTNSFISSHQFISLFQSQQTDIFLWNTTTCLVTVYDNTTTFVLTKVIKIRLSECFERINYIKLSLIKTYTAYYMCI